MTLAAMARSRGISTSSPCRLRTAKPFSSHASSGPTTSATSSSPDPDAAGRCQRTTTRRPMSSGPSRTTYLQRIALLSLQAHGASSLSRSGLSGIWQRDSRRRHGREAAPSTPAQGHRANYHITIASVHAEIVTPASLGEGTDIFDHRARQPPPARRDELTLCRSGPHPLLSPTALGSGDRRAQGRRPAMTVYVGMDVHRKRSQVAIVDQAGAVQRNRNVPNDPAELQPILGRLPAGTPVAFEAAYGWGWLVELLEGLQLQPHLVHPSRCKAIASARLKNDKVDAQTLARSSCARVCCRRRGSRPSRSATCDRKVRHGHITKQGSVWVGWILQEAAQRAKTQPPFAHTYAQIAHRRGRQIATVAIARRLLARCFHILTELEEPTSEKATTGRARITA